MTRSYVLRAELFIKHKEHYAVQSSNSIFIVDYVQYFIIEEKSQRKLTEIKFGCDDVRVPATLCRKGTPQKFTGFLHLWGFEYLAGRALFYQLALMKEDDT